MLAVVVVVQGGRRDLEQRIVVYQAGRYDVGVWEERGFQGCYAEILNYKNRIIK